MEEDQKPKHECRFCNKIFPCGRSLGGHMRSHLITISSSQKKKKKLPPQQKPILVDHKECGKSFQSWMKEDSWNNSTDHHHHHHHHHHHMSADNEAAALCRKKRSERIKKYTNSSSNMDQQEEQEEEVALSLILLSMDCVVESCNTSSDSSEAKKTTTFSCTDTKSSSSKKLDTEFRAPRKRLQSIEDSELEVNSPKTLIKKNGSDHKKKIMNSEVMNENRFSCIICKKGFPSHQALGGHRARHKKFKGCCFPSSDHPAPDFQEKVCARMESKKSKEHQCPICFRVFPSGRALGGHRRSHLTSDQAKNTDPSATTQRRIPEMRVFLDLNSPAPAEEDCNEFETWWICNSQKNLHQPLLSLLSS